MSWWDLEKEAFGSCHWDRVGFLLVTAASMCEGGQANTMAGKVGGPCLGERLGILQREWEAEQWRRQETRICVVVWLGSGVKRWRVFVNESWGDKDSWWSFRSQKDGRSYEKIAVVKKRDISPRMGGKNGAGLLVEVRREEVPWKPLALGFYFCLEK